MVTINTKDLDQILKPRIFIGKFEKIMSKRGASESLIRTHTQKGHNKKIRRYIEEERGSENQNHDNKNT